MQDSSHQLKRCNALLLILAAAYLVWLLVVLLFFHYTPTNDGVGYLEYARQCLAEGAPYPTPTIFREAPFIWNIGFINLVELSLWLTDSIYPLLVVLCLLKALTALLTAHTALRLVGGKAAVAVMLLFVLYPNNWGQSTMLSSEIPSTCLAVVATYLVVSRQSARWLVVSGVLLAFANWIRPTAAIFLGSVIVFLLLFRRQRWLLSITSLLGGYIVTILMIGSMCYMRTGHFLYQARNYWFSMVDECYDGAAVAPHWGQPVWPEGTPRYIENHEQMDCFEYERIWRERSLEWLKDHKTDYLKKIPGRLFYMYQSDYDAMPAFLADKTRSEQNYITLPYRSLLAEAASLSVAQWLSLVCWIFYLLLLVLALAGTVKLLRRRQYESLFLPLFIVVGGSLALVLVMHGETRFKDPLMPFLFILAGCFFAYPPKHPRRLCKR